VVGRLRDRTSINTFDLPTEAQWEYASRAGCELSVNIGMDCTAESVNMVGRNTNNRNDGKGDASLTLVTHVGLYIPNAVGIYDMLGNAAEWCVDAYSEKIGLNDNIDPVGGEADGTWNIYNELLYINRVTKGGGVIATEYGSGFIPGIVDSMHSGNQLGFFDYNYSRSASRVTANEATRYLRCGFRVLFIAE
jgi:formylglycine-generating enzyme required for sulfatase activity